MPGRKGARAREQGLQRTDNDMEFSSWAVPAPINQKNYYTEYLKRDDQILALRLQNDENRNRMANAARNKDRALSQLPQTGTAPPDMEMDMDDVTMAEDGGQANNEADANNFSKIIVVHPGSQNLRIGFASDALPKTIPMVVARISSQNETEAAESNPRPPREMAEDGTLVEPKEAFGERFATYSTNMSTDVKQRMRRKGRRIVPNCKEVAISFNRKASPDIISEHHDMSGIDWTETSPDHPSTSKPKDCFVGQEALRIPDDSRPRYQLFWPLRYGYFNEKAYQSREQMLCDFSLILEEAFKSQLGLSQKRQWSQYSCVFVIPDLFDRNYVTTVLDILLREFGLSRVCFFQESVAGSFGAGHPSCCLVDVGAQKTAICCVDDGMCIEDSRVNLTYGGQDVTEMFIKLLLTDHFPYSEINLNRRYDFLLAEELKQKFCTLSIQDFTAQQYEFHLRVFGQDTRLYSFKAYDEVIIAPMCLFRPEMLEISEKAGHRRKLIGRSRDVYDGSANDSVSAAQNKVIEVALPPDLMDGSQRVSSHNTLKHFSISNGPNGIGTDNQLRPSASTSAIQDDSGTPQNRLSTPAMGDKEGQGATAQARQDSEREAGVRDRATPCIPLTRAIMTSIEHAAKGDEGKTRDFLGGIVATGGGAQIPMFKEFLEEELKEIQSHMRKHIMVAPPPRDIDPQVLVWKGATVFGKLRSNDSWIGGMEYDRLGSRQLAVKFWGNW